MKCPKCKKELEINGEIFDDISIQDIDDLRIDIILECNEENKGCGYKGFWVLGIKSILVDSKT